MSNFGEIESLMKTGRATYLGVGPMSKNCVDAAIEISDELNKPVMLIASRRQIDMADLGGGYVNSWSTEQFTAYVRSKSKKNKMILARDHGGPYQSELEKDMTYPAAMESAKRSYAQDIRYGFDIIHLDPCKRLPADHKQALAKYQSMTEELLGFCNEVAELADKNIEFEVGTDDGAFDDVTPDEFRSFLNDISRFCQQQKIKIPRFVVVPTGTQVLETRNVGTLEQDLAGGLEKIKTGRLGSLTSIAKEYGMFVKEHSADYLNDITLAKHPELGINCANVAPEFGVIETRCFMGLLNKYGQERLSSRFVDLAFDSNKWVKWMIPNTDATKVDRSVIAGHYVFGSLDFLELKKELSADAKISMDEIDETLKTAVKGGILRYMTRFGLA